MWFASNWNRSNWTASYWFGGAIQPSAQSALQPEGGSGKKFEGMRLSVPSGVEAAKRRRKINADDEEVMFAVAGVLAQLLF